MGNGDMTDIWIDFDVTLNANGGTYNGASGNTILQDMHGGDAIGLDFTRTGYNLTGVTKSGGGILSENLLPSSTYTFSGSNYIALGRSYMFSNKLTFALYAYMDNWSQYQSSNMRLISCTESGGFNIEPNGSTVRFAVYDSGKRGYNSITTSVQWSSLSGWVHFAMVFDGTNATGYINGQQVGQSADFTGNIGYNANNGIFIGAEAGSNTTSPAGSYFRGQIRNVHIINDIVNPSDLMELDNEYVLVCSGSATVTAQWEAQTYTITFNSNGGSGTMASQTKTYGVALTLRTNTFTRTGYSFAGWATSANGGVVYANRASFTGNANTTLYAVWEANNPAYYDEDGDYWYVENGYMPQSRVSSSLHNTLASRWSSLSNGTTYTLDGIGNLTSKVYNGNEYCEYNGEYYLVKPIRWRLQASSNQQTGYGTTTDTLAVMDTIVYVGRYSESAINEGDGYSTTAVGYLDNNQISNDYLVSWTQSMPTYGTTSLYGRSENFTARIFVSSMEEIESVAGDYTVRFSDLVSDYLTDGGADLFYYTRNLGTNINNIVCLSIDGDVTQKKPNLNFLGVQFTIKVTEYACV